MKIDKDGLTLFHLRLCLIISVQLIFAPGIVLKPDDN